MWVGGFKWGISGWMSQPRLNGKVVDESWMNGTVMDESWIMDKSWINGKVVDESWMNGTVMDESWINGKVVDDLWMNETVRDESWMNGTVMDNGTVMFGIGWVMDKWDSWRMKTNKSQEPYPCTFCSQFSHLPRIHSITITSHRAQTTSNCRCRK